MTIDSSNSQLLPRRIFLSRSGLGLGTAALGSLLAAEPNHAAAAPAEPKMQFTPRAKRVIYLFMSGGPSHIDLFDPKPLLSERDGEPIPERLIRNHQFAMIKTDAPLLKGSPYAFARHGESGHSISRLLPHTARVADELAVIRSLHTDTFNHDPAVMMMNTGDVRFGRPAMGAWLSYGLGSENKDLPAFVVLASGVNTNQPLLQAYWGNGFLPSHHQGVQFRNQGDPVLYATNPPGIDRRTRRAMLDQIAAANRDQLTAIGDPEIGTRIKQYEMAYRMQMSVPELTDLRQEPDHIHTEYGTQPGQVSFANNCLLARRLVERGVRFVQLYHKGWDSHTKLEADHERQCRETDQPIAALLTDLRRRGLLDDTLVIWGGEFGRTPVAQGTGEAYGRDHHPHGFTMWMAGAGVRQGTVYGSTDDFGYFAEDHPVHVHDLHATVLHLLGIDHRRLTFRLRGRDFRLTDVHGNVIHPILA